jgi:hypothetical protein
VTTLKCKHRRCKAGATKRVIVPTSSVMWRKGVEFCDEHQSAGRRFYSTRPFGGADDSLRAFADLLRMPAARSLVSLD